MRFFQDLNQDVIAARIGFSQMHVSRLLRRAWPASARSCWWSPDHLRP